MALLRIYRHLWRENPKETMGLTFLFFVFVLYWTGLLPIVLEMLRDSLIEAVKPH